jgi:hypothetical protein
MSTLHFGNLFSSAVYLVVTVAVDDCQVLKLVVFAVSIERVNLNK